VSRPPLPRFASYRKTLLVEEDDLPDELTKDGFDPNTYKLIAKASYDFHNPTMLGKVVEVETYDLNKTKKKKK